MTDEPDPTARFHKIRSLRVYGGGFLTDLEIELSPALNCVIGERGTGKTTVLEFLRWVLGSSDEGEWAAEQRRQVSGLIRGNLAKGRIRATIETKDGMRYIVERSAEDPAPVVYDESHEPTKLTLEHGSLFAIDAYSVNALEHIASSSEAQLELIDRFITAELQPLRARDKRLVRALEDNAAELLALRGQLEENREELLELPNVEARLASLAIEGGAEADAAREQVELKDRRDREARYLARLAEGLEDDGRELARWAQRLEQLEASSQLPDELADGASEALLEAAGAYHAHREALSKLARDAEALLEATGEELAGHAEQIAQAHRAAEADYQRALGQLKQQQAHHSEREQLMRRCNELRDRDAHQKELLTRLDAALASRAEAVASLVETRSARTAARRQVAARLSRELGPDIRIEIDEGGGVERYRRALQAIAKAANRRPGEALLRSISQAVPPVLLAQLLAEADEQQLADRLGVEASRIDWLLSAAGQEAQYQLEALDIEDVPRIQLDLGHGYRESAELSTGQKCTTILPILLLESDRPLLIDQPEDNLDNAYIYDVVVARLLQVKTRRQLIFVTHNPNIPVLGDAERVLVLTADGQRAKLQAAGDVGAVRAEIEHILEGGPEAFCRRMERYGH